MFTEMERFKLAVKNCGNMVRWLDIRLSLDFVQKVLDDDELNAELSADQIKIHGRVSFNIDNYIYNALITTFDNPKQNWIIKQQQFDTNCYFGTNLDFPIITVIKEKSILTFEKENGDKAYYDLATEEYTTHIVDKPVKHPKDLRKFFTHYRVYHLCALDNIYAKFLYTIQQIEYRSRNIQSFLDKFNQYIYLEQMMAYPGLRIAHDESYTYTNKRKMGYLLTKPLSYYNKTFIKNLIKYDIPLNLEVEKAVTQNQNDLSLFYKVMDLIFESQEYVDLFFNRFMGYSGMIWRIKQYNLDPETYLHYIYTIVHHEGLSIGTAVNNHFDYLRMTSIMLKGKKNNNKYPKMLLSIHNIATKNYNKFKESIPDEDTMAFQEIVAKDDYQKLAYHDSQYEIIIPTVPKQLKTEGAMLNHCVGSYIQQVINGETKIVFLRKKEAPESPFVTVEVKHNKLWQVSADYNHRPDKHVINFLHRFCKKFNISAGKY